MKTVVQEVRSLRDRTIAELTYTYIYLIVIFSARRGPTVFGVIDQLKQKNLELVVPLTSRTKIWLGYRIRKERWCSKRFEPFLMVRSQKYTTNRKFFDRQGNLRRWKNQHYGGMSIIWVASSQKTPSPPAVFIQNLKKIKLSISYGSLDFLSCGLWKQFVLTR